MARIKEVIFGILEPGGKDSKYFDPFIMTLIVLNVVAVILETVSWLYLPYKTAFHIFDIFSVAIFSIEYCLRIWTCSVDPRYRDPLTGRIRFALTPMAIVDLVAILPFYLPLILPEMRFIRVVRLFRVFRILKIARYTDSLNTFANVFRSKREDLTITLFAIVVLLVIASSLMYQAENQAQPEKFTSIPAAMWWGVVTLATIGYGDVYPITPIGKLIGSIVIFLGIALFALPTGIFASGFVEELDRKRNRRMICPHCGRYYDEAPEETGKACTRVEIADHRKM
ncbi:MAG TPA: ion transporter [Methanotrichaceae archaeon]|nr:ion transporter [Methanotrichaceae archaeon]